MSIYIHPLADVQSPHIGADTTIWQFSVILKEAVIGDNCNINCHTFIENDVIIGNHVTIKSGVYVWDGLRISDYAFIGPAVVFTNDLRPRSKQRVKFPETHIGEGASLGANTTVLAGVRIGKYAMTGISSVVTNDVPDYALVYGSPARIMGWLDEKGNKLTLLEDGSYESKTGNRFIVTDNQLIKQ